VIFSQTQCPKCGADPETILQTVQQAIYIRKDEVEGPGWHDNAEQAPRTYWDTAFWCNDTGNIHKDDHYTLGCENGHSWDTETIQ